MEIFKNYFQIYKGGVMFCPKCGKEVNDDADVCVNCGRALKDMTEKPEHNTPKTGLGIVMGLFLGIIILEESIDYILGNIDYWIKFAKKCWQ